MAPPRSAMNLAGGGDSTPRLPGRKRLQISPWHGTMQRLAPEAPRTTTSLTESGPTSLGRQLKTDRRNGAGLRERHSRTLLQSCDLPGGLAKDASAQAAGLAAKDCCDDGWRLIISRRVSGFLRAFVPVCYGCAGDPAFVRQPEADAVLRGNGRHWFDRRMHLAVFAGEKRR